MVKKAEGLVITQFHQRSQPVLFGVLIESCEDLAGILECGILRVAKRSQSPSSWRF